MSETKPEFFIGFITAISFFFITIPITFELSSYGNFYDTLMLVLLSVLISSFVSFLLYHSLIYISEKINSRYTYEDNNLRKTLNEKYVNNEISTEKYKDNISKLDEIENTVSDKPSDVKEHNTKNKELEEDIR